MIPSELKQDPIGEDSPRARQSGQEHFEPGAILVAEFEYIAWTTFQADEDRARVPPYVVGNLLTQSFEGVWHSPKMEAWRAIIPPECAGCAVYESCHGGCRAEAMLRHASSYPLSRKPYRVGVPFETGRPGLRVAA